MKYDRTQQLLVGLKSLLKLKFHGCESGEEDRCAGALAHLFAACEYLFDHISDNQLSRSNPGPESCTGWWHAQAHLDNTPANNEVDLYWHLLALLCGLDAGYGSQRELFGLPLWSALDDIPDLDHAEPVLAGKVRHWIRPRSLLRDLQEARQSSGSPIVRQLFRPRDQLRHLGMIWDRGECLLCPVPAADSRGRPLSIIEESGRRLQSGRFSIALCPLQGEFWPRFRPSNESKTFIADEKGPVHRPEEQTTHLRTVVEDAIQAEVDMVVFPELTVDSAARQHLVECLADKAPGSTLQAVVAGSFHFQRDGKTYNESMVLGQRGNAIWSHRKAGYFRVTGAEIRAMLKSEDKPKLIVPDATWPGSRTDEYVEDISKGKWLQFLDTALGRVAVVICADVLDDERFRRHVIDGRIELLMIVSMTTKVEPFLRYAHEMARFGVAVLFVNAACICPWIQSPEVPVAALAFLQMKKVALPTMLRWRLDTKQVEALSSKTGKWQVVAPEGETISVLPGRRGLVLNIGAFWHECFPTDEGVDKVKENEKTWKLN